MKNKVIIIDDDPNGVLLLKRYLSLHNDRIELAGEAYNCEQGVSLIQATNPDLVLLDVEMPDGSGFDVIKRTQEYSFYSIIITAFEKFAISAFDVGALHFLCKPVEKEKFNNALIRFYEQTERDKEHSKDILPTEILTEQKIKIPRIYGYDIVAIKDIIRLQANGSYTKIHLSTGESVLVSKHLKTYEDSLHSLGFVRIQKSHLVNTSYIKSIRKGKKGIIVLNDNTHLYFSSTYKDDILKYFIA